MTETLIIAAVNALAVLGLLKIAVDNELRMKNYRKLIDELSGEQKSFVVRIADEVADLRATVQGRN